MGTVLVKFVGAAALVAAAGCGSFVLTAAGLSRIHASGRPVRH